MIDLEREVRELLERRADEVAGPIESRMSTNVRSRVRTRQARTILGAGVLAVVVGATFFAGVRPALRPPTVQPGDRGESPAPPLGGEDRHVVASGEVGGDPWQLLVGRGENFWCVDIEMNGNGVGTCGQLLEGGHLAPVVLQGPGLPGILVGGAISQEVDRVVFDRDEGDELEGTLYPTSTDLKAPFDVFAILVPKDRRVGGAVLALDSEGNVLAQHGVYPESVLANGEFRGHRWTLLYLRQSQCLEALISRTRYPICNASVPDRRFIDWTTIGFPAERENLLFGFVHPDTDRLVVEVAGSGPAEARIFPLPWDAELRAFLVEIDGYRGELVAIDAIGEEIRRKPFRLIPFSEG